MSKIAKATISLMIVSVISKIFGFCREIVLASTYGTSMYSDAYVTALNIPNVIFAMIGSALTTTIIPIYSSIYEKKGSKFAQDFLSNTISITSLIGLLIVSIGIVFTEQIVKLFAIGFNGELLQITVIFTRILFISILFISINNILTSFLHINNRFIIAGMIGIPYSVIIIIFILLSINISVYLLPVGTLVATIIQCILITMYAYKQGYRYKFKINIYDKYIKQMLILIMPVMVGIGVSQINNIIDRTLASTLGVGTVSAFNYANRLYGFVQGLFISSIISVIYPNMSKLAAKNEIIKLKSSINEYINILGIILMPITVGAFILSNPIVEVVFKRGAFDDKATVMTSNILKIYMLGIIAFALRELLAKIFYSLQDTKTPMKNGVISILLNIILNLILVRYLGYKGLAIASSISAFVGVILLFNSLIKKVGSINLGGTFIKVIIISLLMGVVTKISYDLLLNSFILSKFSSMLISIIISAFVYIILILLAKIDEVSNTINKLIKIKA